MTHKTLKSGDVQVAAQALIDAGAKLRIKPSQTGKHRVLELLVGSAPKTIRLQTEYKQELDRLEELGTYLTPVEKSNLLCSYQRQQRATGYRPFNLGTNIYGWAVGSLMLSNMGGGKWARTRRGLDLEQAVRWGVDATEKEETTFTITICNLDEKDNIVKRGRTDGSEELLLELYRELRQRSVPVEKLNGR